MKSKITQEFLSIDEQSIQIETVDPKEVSTSKSAIKESAYYKALLALQPDQSFSYPSKFEKVMAYALKLLRQENDELKFRTKTISETHKRIFRIH